MTVRRVEVRDRASKYFGKFKLTAADGRDLGYSSYTGTKPTAAQTVDASIAMLNKKMNGKGLNTNDKALANALTNGNLPKKLNVVERAVRWVTNSSGQQELEVNDQAKQNFIQIHNDRLTLRNQQKLAKEAKKSEIDMKANLDSTLEAGLKGIYDSTSPKSSFEDNFFNGKDQRHEGQTLTVALPEDTAKRQEIRIHYNELVEAKKSLDEAKQFLAKTETEAKATPTTHEANQTAIQAAKLKVENLESTVTKKQNSIRLALTNVDENAQLKSYYNEYSNKATEARQSITNAENKITENKTASNKFVGKQEKVKTPTPTPENTVVPPVNETSEAQKAREEAAAKKRQAERDEKNWWTQPFEDGEAWGIIGRLAAGASIVGPVAALLKWIFGGKQQPPQQ